MDTPSKWVRRRPALTATRVTDGLTVAFADDAWWLSHPGILTSSGSLYRERFDVFRGLNHAITLADAKYPPKVWSLDPNTHVWQAHGWTVYPLEDGWGASRDGKVATSRTFLTADVARVWAEMRFDRARVKLRGPKPRGVTPSTFRFPDIRVNEGERRQLEQVIDALKCPYAVFVRAACRWASENATGDDATWQLRDERFERVPR